MIIFGWGHASIKNYGPTYKIPCKNCGNENHWYLSRTMTWFTLFFIPIFPYNIKYFLYCPVCQNGINVEGEQVKELRPLAEANQLLVDGSISEIEYKSKIESLSLSKGENQKDTVEVTEEKKDAGTGEGKQGNMTFMFCTQCGNKVEKTDKFCGRCGDKNQNV